LIKTISKLALALVIFASCAKKHTYYEVGRPKSIEENNARKVIAKSWDLSLEHSSEMSDEAIKKINHHNDSVNSILVKKKGENWQDSFNSEVRQELVKHVNMRATISQMEIFAKAKEQLFEPIILFEKKKNNYLAHIVGQKKNDEERKFITFAQISINGSDLSAKVKSELSQPLTISFPENGVK
jgi:hypothetical protein